MGRLGRLKYRFSGSGGQAPDLAAGTGPSDVDGDAQGTGEVTQPSPVTTPTAEEPVQPAPEQASGGTAVFTDGTDGAEGQDGGAAPTPGSAARAAMPTLLRHSPFQFGFTATFGGLLALFLFQQIERLSGILVLLVLSMFLAIGLSPLVEWLMRRGLKRGLSLGIVLLGVVGTVVLFVLAVVPVLSEQITTIAKNAPDWFDRLIGNPTFKDLNERYEIIQKVTDYIQDGDFVASVSGGALDFGLALLSAVTNTFIVLVLTIYFLASLPAIKQAIYQLAPASKRERVRTLGDRIFKSMGAYVAGAILVALCAGISTLIFCFVVGLGDYAIALGFVVGLLSLIPVIGAFISGAIMTLLALTVSPTTALVALGYYLAYQQFESYFISPRIMKRAVDIPAALTVIAALVGGSLMGVIGALLAVPFAAALLLLHREVFLRRQDSL